MAAVAFSCELCPKAKCQTEEDYKQHLGSIQHKKRKARQRGDASAKKVRQRGDASAKKARQRGDASVKSQLAPSFLADRQAYIDGKTGPVITPEIRTALDQIQGTLWTLRERMLSDGKLTGTDWDPKKTTSKGFSIASTIYNLTEPKGFISSIIKHYGHGSQFWRARQLCEAICKCICKIDGIPLPSKTKLADMQRALENHAKGLADQLRTVGNKYVHADMTSEPEARKAQEHCGQVIAFLQWFESKINGYLK